MRLPSASLLFSRLSEFPVRFKQTSQARNVLACSKDPATRESRIMRRIHVGAQECLHRRQGNMRAQAWRVTNLRSLSLRLPNERVPWCIWAELGVSRHFRVNSRGSHSDP